jgi:hypothetical protein
MNLVRTSARLTELFGTRATDLERFVHGGDRASSSGSRRRGRPLGPRRLGKSSLVWTTSRSSTSPTCTQDGSWRAVAGSTAGDARRNDSYAVIGERLSAFEHQTKRPHSSVTWRCGVRFSSSCLVRIDLERGHVPQRALRPSACAAAPAGRCSSPFAWVDSLPAFWPYR